MKRMTMDKTSEDVLNEMDNLDKLYKKVKSDFKKVDMTFDNFMYYAKGTYTYLCSAHKSDEMPVFFVLYYDTNDKLRAYIPKHNFLSKEDKNHIRHAIPLDSTELSKWFDSKDSIHNIYDDFHKHICPGRSRKQMVSYATIDKEQFDKYIEYVYNKDMDVSILDFVYKDCIVAIDYDDITNVKVEYFSNDIVPHLVMRFSSKDNLDFFGYIFIDNKNALRLYIPVIGNNLNRFTIEPKSNKEIDYADFKKMDKDFRKGIIRKGVCRNKFSRVNLFKWNGIPVEKIKDEKVEANESSHDEIKNSFNLNWLKKELEMKLKHSVTIETKIDDEKMAECGKENIQYEHVYFYKVKCHIDGYHDFYVFVYLDKDNNPKYKIPYENNSFYQGHLIEDKYKTPYIDIGKVNENVFVRIEEEQEEFAVYDLRHARKFGKDDLLKHLTTDILSEVPPDDLREEVNGLKFNTNIVETDDDLVYNVMDYDNGKVCFYLDRMNKLRAYIPYNKDYKRDIEETIIC